MAGGVFHRAVAEPTKNRTLRAGVGRKRWRVCETAAARRRATGSELHGDKAVEVIEERVVAGVGLVLGVVAEELAGAKQARALSGSPSIQ